MSFFYIRTWRKWGLFFVIIGLLAQSFFIGIGHTKVISVANSFMVAVNIILDYCLIFGNFGFPAMGISGAAFASVLAEMSGALFYIVYIMVSVDRVKYNLFAFTRFSASFLKPLLRISLPTMLQNLLSFSCWLLFFFIIENMLAAILPSPIKRNPAKPSRFLINSQYQIIVAMRQLGPVEL